MLVGIVHRTRFAASARKVGTGPMEADLRNEFGLYRTFYGVFEEIPQKDINLVTGPILFFRVSRRSLRHFSRCTRLLFHRGLCEHCICPRCSKGLWRVLRKKSALRCLPGQTVFHLWSVSMFSSPSTSGRDGMPVTPFLKM